MYSGGREDASGTPPFVRLECFILGNSPGMNTKTPFEKILCARSRRNFIDCNDDSHTCGTMRDAAVIPVALESESLSFYQMLQGVSPL